MKMYGLLWFHAVREYKKLYNPTHPQDWMTEKICTGADCFIYAYLQENYSFPLQTGCFRTKTWGGGRITIQYRRPLSSSLLVGKLVLDKGLIQDVLRVYKQAVADEPYQIP